MSDRMEFSALRRLDLVYAPSPKQDQTPDSGRLASVHHNNWRWFLLPFQNALSPVKAADLFVQVDDLRLQGNGSVVLGNQCFRHGWRIDEYCFRGMVARRGRGWGRILEIEAGEVVYRFFFSLDCWYLLVPASGRLGRLLFPLWRPFRMVVGMARRIWHAAVRVSRNLWWLLIACLITYAAYVLIKATIVSS